MITKLLANRLQLIIQHLIHKNQYGFIHTRTIQDSVAWAFEYMHLYHHSKKQIIILKVDFVEHMGFGSTLLHWMRSIFSLGTSSVLLNGVPCKTFHCKRGIRQGDPLSPLLFVLAADLIQSALNQAKDQGLLSLPIPLNHSKGFPILQYTDDTLIIMDAEITS